MYSKLSRSLLTLAALLVACGANAQPIHIKHLHGLGYSADGKQLIVPAHDGLVIYENGQWRVPDAPINDYMGYAPSDEGFYSSGHPGPDTKRVNPLGLIKSSDLGKTLTTLAFEGESDFHMMAVGYGSHAIYVLNTTPNSKLGVGLFYSLDDAKTWTQSNAQGLTGQLVQLAAHPSQANIIAAVTQDGSFLSTDHGQTFERVAGVDRAAATTFTPDGQAVLFGLTGLQTYSIPDGQVASLGAPRITADDAISNIAINPVSGDIAIATFAKHVFVTNDRGSTWKQIATAGEAL